MKHRVIDYYDVILNRVQFTALPPKSNRRATVIWSTKIFPGTSPFKELPLPLKYPETTNNKLPPYDFMSTKMLHYPKLFPSKDLKSSHYSHLWIEIIKMLVMIILLSDWMINIMNCELDQTCICVGCEHKAIKKINLHLNMRTFT